MEQEWNWKLEGQELASAGDWKFWNMYILRATARPVTVPLPVAEPMTSESDARQLKNSQVLFRGGMTRMLETVTGLGYRGNGIMTVLRRPSSSSAARKPRTASAPAVGSGGAGGRHCGGGGSAHCVSVIRITIRRDSVR